MLADQILDFLFNLQLLFPLPNNIEALDVYKIKGAQQTSEQFYNKYYNDNNKRYLMLGINPGRFGGGLTGIPFTDPLRLSNDCGITHSFNMRAELSSVFMYEMMHTYGGIRKFYSKFYISSISPLGFVKDNKNLNYYDDKELMQIIEPFAIDCINKQLAFGLQKDICFCIGEGTNFKYLHKLNEEYQWFEKIIPLPHPRFIMQYKLKQKEKYIATYLDKLKFK